MAIPKVCGIETEYGIITRGFDSNPVVASSVLVNAFSGTFTPTTGWDFIDESPGADARGFSLDDAFPPEIETHLVNTVLTNGARYYVDHAHPEVSTPECKTPSEAVLYDRAGEEIIRQSMAAAAAKLPTGHEIITYKNNSDGKGNSYGCHENYLVSRDLPFGKLAAFITTHFVTRQVFCGTGKVGTEQYGRSYSSVPFQISQRADFFEEEIGLETTLRRPIVNTRDEPHCDPEKYRRLHVIIGDANMSEFATLAKVGTTAIVLAMIEDDFLPHDLVLESPLHALSTVSNDLSLTTPIETVAGRKMSALQMQTTLLEYATRYAEKRGLGCIDANGGDAEGRIILALWEELLVGLSTDPSSVSDVVDWVAKKQLIEAFADRHSLAPASAKLKALDLQYHDMRPDKCLALKMGLRTLVNQEQVLLAAHEPPETTRAYFRGKCLQKWPHDIVSANWDSLVFDIGDEPLRRIPMMEPLKGTKVMVESLIQQAQTPRELLHLLGTGGSFETSFRERDMY